MTFLLCLYQVSTPNIKEFCMVMLIKLLDLAEEDSDVLKFLLVEGDVSLT